MKNILLVLSSPRGQQSYSHQVASDIVDDLKLRHPGATLVVRDLAKEPLPHVGEAFVGGLFSPPEQRSPDQARAMARSDKLIDELFAADVVVMAVPMHNFGLPSTLKAWIDHIARAGRTFAYSEKGPQGLLKEKKAILVLARGGVYSDGPAKPLDFQESYLRSILGFLGITDVQVVRVEGVAMGEDAVKRALASARAQADTVTRAFAS
jgi:FMN-dependent NADH-azoreductase